MHKGKRVEVDGLLLKTEYKWNSIQIGLGEDFRYDTVSSQMRLNIAPFSDARLADETEFNVFDDHISVIAVAGKRRIDRQIFYGEQQGAYSLAQLLQTINEQNSHLIPGIGDSIEIIVEENNFFLRIINDGNNEGITLLLPGQNLTYIPPTSPKITPSPEWYAQASPQRREDRLYFTATSELGETKNFTWCVKIHPVLWQVAAQLIDIAIGKHV